MSSVQMNLATLETSKASEGQEISKTLKVPQILEILDSQRINMPLVERAQQTLETVDLPKESPEGMAIFTNHTNEVHHQHMRAALEMAEKALHGDEVPVGCVFVRNGEIIGRGMNDTNRSLCGTRHAEFIAIESILRHSPPEIFADTDLYVTVEPCVMCSSALRQLRIRRVFFGCLNDRFGGCGGVLKIHEGKGVDPTYPIHGGIKHDEAIMLLRRFYIQENERAPQPLAKKSRTLKTEVLPFGEGFPRDKDCRSKKRDMVRVVENTPLTALEDEDIIMN